MKKKQIRAISLGILLGQVLVLSSLTVSHAETENQVKTNESVTLNTPQTNITLPQSETTASSELYPADSEAPSIIEENLQESSAETENVFPEPEVSEESSDFEQAPAGETTDEENNDTNTLETETESIPSNEIPELPVAKTGDFSFSGEADQAAYHVENGVLTILKSGHYQLGLVEGLTQTSERIIIAAPNVTITLNQMTIISQGAPIQIQSGASLQLQFSGSNQLQGETAGIQNDNLHAESLQLNGDGQLTLSGAYGISGGVTLNRGTIEASGTVAGIGGNGAVVMNGGHVTAQCLGSGKGINGSTVTVNGGILHALDAQGNSDSIIPSLNETTEPSTATDNQLTLSEATEKEEIQPLESDQDFSKLAKVKQVIVHNGKKRYLEWNGKEFVDAQTYTVKIQKSIQLTDAGETELPILMTNHFQQVEGYDRKVSVHLANQQQLMLRKEGDLETTIQASLSWMKGDGVRLAANQEKSENTLKIGSPQAIGEGPIRAGKYRGKLEFKIAVE